jgi:uncharacterized protein YjbI with pentapeptide repeats
MQANLCLPFLFGTKVTSRVPGKLEMTVAVRGVFRLAPGQPVAPLDDLVQLGLQGDLFAEGDDDRTGALVHASDFADFKLKTDLLLRGTCYPGAEPAKVCEPRFTVGSWSKSVRVIGRRVWKDGVLDAISDPVPFDSMPITYANAFGGPEFPRNPVGKGHKSLELPTVENPTALVRSRRDTPDPAGFGPLSPSWPQRSQKVGNDYGASWKKTRAPFYATDFDWSHFNAAPEDQQQTGYLRGDEPLSFEFLHPKATRFSTQLPGVRPRVFVRRTDEFRGEVPMNLDTLVADLDGERLILVWRGLVEVHDDQLDDVRTLLIGSDGLTSPLPADHYLLELEALDKDPIAYFKDKLAPAELKQALQQGKEMAAEANAEAAEEAARRAAAPTDPVGRMRSSLGALKDQPPEQVKALEGMLEKAATFVQKNESRLADMKERGQGAVTPTSDGLYDAAAKMLATQKARVAARGGSTEAYDRAEKQIAEARAQRGSPPPPPPAAEAEPGPGADLMERDLSGRDLSGVDLRKALLRKAKLVGTKLVGANLSGADLSEADLEGADLTGADLTRANLMGVRAPGTVFEDALFSQTIFQNADLSRASLVGAKGSMVAFNETSLRDAQVRGVRLHKAYFGKCNLDGADFTGAELDICAFLEISGLGTRFRSARLTKVCFLRSKMTEASFYGAAGEGCSWQGTTLDRADFRYAKLRGAQLNKASLRKANLLASDFRGGRFERASLAEADFSKADLMSVSFCRAQLEATNFSGASLYDAKFLRASAREKCNFEGANLTRAIWEQP